VRTRPGLARIRDEPAPAPAPAPADGYGSGYGSGSGSSGGDCGYGSDGAGYGGFSGADVNELLCQGIKPWDDDAGAVLAALNGDFGGGYYTR